MNEERHIKRRMAAALGIIERCKAFAPLVPEVRSNFACAKKNAETPADVLAVDGRITVVGGMPKAAGRLRFGASSHIARFILEMRKYEPSVSCAINFANSPEISKWLEKYCGGKGWALGCADRSHEPAETQATEGASMPWKVRKAVEAAGGVSPKILYETGAVGKEPVSVIVGDEPVRLAVEMCELAKSYVHRGLQTPKIGKIDAETFNEIILKKLGKKDKRILVPPMAGVDAGVIDIGGGRVLVVAEDPIFTIPNTPPEFFGWATVHIGASDIAVMGVKPQYMTYSLLLPPETASEEVKAIVGSIHAAALGLGISIVGGHTGHYPGFVSPTIGGITVFSIASRDSYVTPAGAKPGDEVILTKGPAIETAAVLALLREKELLARYPKEIVGKAKALCRQMSVVKDALIAKEAGGVTSMHDATEGGVMGGLFEIANASKVGMEIDESKFIYPEEVRMVCDAFGIDPVESIAEGALLITANPGSSRKIIARLKEEGIQSSIIGKINEDAGKRVMRRTSGKTVPIQIPRQDPFWLKLFNR